MARVLVADTGDSNSGGQSTTFDVLGVGVAVTNLKSAIARIQQWIDSRDRVHYVTFTNVHAVMEAYGDSSFRDILNAADMVCPDGMPLVWVGRMRGANASHVCGPDLMGAFVRDTHQTGYSHFFYGAAPGVADALAHMLQKEYPGMRIAGTYSPPYRPLTEEENAMVVKEINKAAPDVLWIGLGCPKQERWMYEHRRLLRVPVMLGVGQAFDIYAGNLIQSPRWMRDHGLEWAFRLCCEPKRLWRRYLLTNTTFALALASSVMKRS